MQEIYKCKLHLADEIHPENLGDYFNNCDYLNYVVKEALRFDPPGPITLPYKAYETVDL